ncbi:MAG: APC family permease, partial [Alphaproteobacteria bacterium]|nr:APC family permease [Alphaproteobacteria bacterium]
MTLQNTPNRLRSGRLGAAAISFFVISAAAPLTGVAGGFPIAMLLGNGAGAPFVFLLITLLLLIFSVGYTSMAQHVSNAGAFYAFTAQGLGGVMGSSAAFIALLAYNALQIGLYGLFGTVAAGTIADLTGLLWPWYVWAGLAWAMIAVMGYRQIDLSLKILSVLVVLEYGVVLLLNLLIIAKGGHQGAGIGFQSFTPTALLSGVPIMSVLVCFASFMGFEATTIYAEEARNPKRTIKLATYCSVLLIGGFFTLTSWLMIEGNGAANLVNDLSQLKDEAGNPDPTQFIYVLTDKFGGSWLTMLTHLLFLSSLFAALQAFHNAAARYFYVLGREGLLPAKMGMTHHRFQSPHIGS